MRELSMKKTIIVCLHFLFLTMTLSAIDIDVTYIDRTPNYPYDAVKNKPDVGDIVTYIAHVKLYDSPGQNANYIWYYDGIQIGEGTVFLNPGIDNTVAITRIWDGGRHEIMIQFDPEDNLSEESEENNIVYNFTDGLIVGFAVEETIVNAYPDFQKQLGIGSVSFEDWFQRQIKIWNLVLMEKAGELKSDAVIDVKDRVRGVISYNGDGTLVNGNCPLVWKEVDMLWGRLASDLDWVINNRWSWGFEGSLPHELSHARYLPDNYILDVGASAIEIIDDSGVLVTETDYMPKFGWDHVYLDKNDGMMTGDYSGRYSLFGACLLNRVAGQRALGCNTNGCCTHNTNWFNEDFPKNMYLKILHLDGSPWINAKLDIYKREGHYSNVRVDNIIDYTLYTDSSGRAELPPAVFTETSYEFILKITSPDDGMREYRFIERSDFHIAYWLGETDSFTYIINTEFDPVPVAETVDLSMWLDRGVTFDITFHGRYFKEGCYFRFNPAVVRTNSDTFISPSEVKANLTILEQNLRQNQIAYRMYNPDGKFVRRMDAYDQNLILNINNRKPFSHFTSFDISDRIPRAYYFNGLWSHDWSGLFDYVDGPLPLPGTGRIVSYEWDFGDGSPKSYEPFVVHQFNNAGTYLVTLTVTDTDNETASRTKSIVTTFVLPEPDIKANGSDAPIVITKSDALSLTIELDAGAYPGVEADWWLVAMTPQGWYYYDKSVGWLPGREVTLQVPLRDLPLREVLNMSGLPAGNYTFYFGVDLVQNGKINMSQAYYDTVEVTITP